METIYRQKRFSKLTPKQQKAKLKEDSRYEIAVQNLSTAFYQKKRTVGVIAEEEEAYNKAKAKLWNDYRTWAIGEDLYEEVTPEQQLAEVEDGLSRQVEKANLVRQKLGLKQIELKEKTAKGI